MPRFSIELRETKTYQIEGDFTATTPTTVETQQPGYKNCAACFGTGCETDENGVQRDEPCPECIGEGIVPNEDKICASCFDAGQVVEMDGYNADGEPMCYDCLDARDDVQPED